MAANHGVELGVREAARLAGRTPETIRRWVWSGRLDARREGNRLILSRDQVLRLSGAVVDEPVSLGDWARDAAVLRRGGPGASAADLVTEDRRAREDVDAGR